MDSFNIEATVFFKHQPDEVRALSRAIIPMADYIRAVSGHIERHRFKVILEGGYFRVNEARGMRTVFLRAANHARAHLEDYFPLMREQIVTDAETLEEAVADYWREFHRLQNEVVATK
jgi:hypothetical protein